MGSRRSSVDQVAIVTGASSGIGAATARALAQQRAHVVRTLAVPTGMSRPEEITDLVALAVAEFGRVDAPNTICVQGQISEICRLTRCDVQPDDDRWQLMLLVLTR